MSACGYVEVLMEARRGFIFLGAGVTGSGKLLDLGTRKIRLVLYRSSMCL